MTVLCNKDSRSVDIDKLKFGEAAFYLTLDFSSFSGKKTAKDSEVFSLNGKNVSSVTEKPRKKLVDSKNIKFVQKHYMRAKRVFDDIGVPIWGGWLVPKHSIDELKADFLEIKKSYDIEAHSFVSAYATLLEQQCEQNPEIADFIKNDAPCANDVRSKFYMRLSPMLAISLRDDDEIEEVGNAISFGLFGQFKKMAEETIKNLQDRDTVRLSTIHKNLLQIRSKANTFAFSDPVWDGTVGFVDAIIKRLPVAGGKLEPSEKALLMLALGMFTDEKRLKIAASEINSLDLETLLMPKVEASTEEDDLMKSLTSLRQLDDELTEEQGSDSNQEKVLTDYSPDSPQHIVDEPVLKATEISSQELDLLGAFFG